MSFERPSTSDRETERIVRSWLAEGTNRLPDRVLDAVLDEVPSTPQRRAWWPAWRFPDMNTYAKVAIAAAAVLVIAVVGINLLPANGGVGGSGATASPSASPSPTPQPSPSPTPAALFPPSGELAVGVKESLTLDGLPISFRVPTSGWFSNGAWGIEKVPDQTLDATAKAAQRAGFIFWVDDTPTGVFADPCTGSKAPPVGPSPADLAAAVASIPGTDLVSGPSDVTVGGHPAKQVVVTIRDDIGCDPTSFDLWYSPTEGIERYASELGSTIRAWIIDVDGTTVWIDGETFKGADTEPGQEIQQIIDSIQFE